MIDQFGQERSGAPESILAWDQCVSALLAMRGDPMTALEQATSQDPSFVMGVVFTGVYRILGASPPKSPGVVGDLSMALERKASGNRQEAAHVAAFATLVAGDFFSAAKMWDAIVFRYPRDLVAARIAHDIYLHIGNISDRLESATRALDPWVPGEAGYGWLMGNYSFALEEAGLYREAEHAGRVALEENQTDCWALHSLAHVYEHLDSDAQAMDLLYSNQRWWAESDLLANHIWWHLGLRLLENRQFDEVLAIADDVFSEVATPFSLADITSLLWRLELEGCSVGDRWDSVVQRWGTLNTFHTSAFIDMHAAMAFASVRGTPSAAKFWAGTVTPHFGHSPNGQYLQETGAELVATLSAFRDGDRVGCEDGFRAIADDLDQVGGSRAQREILTKTRVRNMTLGQDPATASYLDSLLQEDPDRSWIRRERQYLTQKIGSVQ